MFFKIPVAFETSSFGYTPTLDCGWPRHVKTIDYLD